MLEHEKLTSSVVFSDLDWRNVAIHLLCRKIMSVAPRPSSHTVVQNQTRERQRIFRGVSDETYYHPPQKQHKHVNQ